MGGLVKAGGVPPAPPVFFISYNQADRQWAEWIAWQLEGAGYNTFIQAWDIQPGQDFVIAMQNASEEADRTIAVLSPDYLSAKFTQREWAAAFARDPTGESGILVPIRVREVELRGMWVTLVYIDLVGIPEEAARRALLSGIERTRKKPLQQPPFPDPQAEHRFPDQREGSKLPLRPEEPVFPISTPIQDDPLRDWALLATERYSDDTLIYSFRVEGERLTISDRTHFTHQLEKLIQRYIERLERVTSLEVMRKKSLFELLVPSSLRSYLRSTDKLCLLVDRQSASYPWEMLADVELETSTFAVRTGLLRQFAVPSRRFVEDTSHCKTECLVIGAPRASGFAPLHEAKAVAALLSHHGESVLSFIGAEASEIVSALFTGPYRIIHVATDSFVNDFPNTGIGLAVDPHLVISPEVFCQMAILPDVIFLNFGLQEEPSPGDEYSNPKGYGRVAAYFAETLVGMGVGAVVISGWAIDTDCSVEFAKEFYRALLAGNKFPEAVRRARNRAYRANIGSNTYAAFHCYGSPNFLLNNDMISARSL